MKLRIWILKRRQIHNHHRIELLDEVTNVRVSRIDRLFNPSHGLFVLQRHIAAIEMINSLVGREWSQILGDVLKQVLSNFNRTLGEMLACHKKNVAA